MDTLPEHDLDPVRSLAQYDDVEQVAAARDAHLDLFIVHATVHPVPGETPASCANARTNVARALDGTALHPGAPCRRTARVFAATRAALRRPGAAGTGHPRRRSTGASPWPRRSGLDEGHDVARVLLLLLDRLFLLRRVLRFLLAFLRGLVGHDSLLWNAETTAPPHYSPMCRGALGSESCRRPGARGQPGGSSGEPHSSFGAGCHVRPASSHNGRERRSGWRG